MSVHGVPAASKPSAGHVLETPLQRSGWSHSLAGAALWSALFGLCFWRQGRAVMAATGLAAFSHFPLDFVSENLVPGHIENVYRFDYTLQPLPQPNIPAEESIGRVVSHVWVNDEYKHLVLRARGATLLARRRR